MARRVLGAVLVVGLAVLAGWGAMAGLNRVVNGPAATVAPGAETVDVVPTAGTTGASTCTDPVGRHIWRVTWKVTAGAGPDAASGVSGQAEATAIAPTGFAVRPLTPGTQGAQDAQARSATGWIDDAQDRWQLNWSPTLAEVAKAPKDETWSRIGGFATLAADKVYVGQSPRYVAPDGSCTVFLTPFVSGRAGRPTIAVVGDSLTAQLYAPDDNSFTGPGALAERLESGGDRVEINGQAGRRWTPDPDQAAGLEQADYSMDDEIRGLRAAGTMVIALGTNDAGWVAISPNQETYELRLSWVLLHLTPLIDELRADGRCTVLVTMADRDKRYLDSDPAKFQEAAGRINALFEQRADADSHDGLKVYDWAAQADPHGYGTKDAWFGYDYIHLTAAGIQAYANDLTQAAGMCS
jgi:lysophospholipase L1-like esterase